MADSNSLFFIHSGDVPSLERTFHGIKAKCSSKVGRALSRTQKKGGNFKPDPIRIRREQPSSTFKSIPKTKSDTFSVPAGCCAAPSDKFSETEEAFEKIIRDYKYDFLKIQAEYDHKIIDKQKYVTQLFSLCCKAMDIDDVELDLTTKKASNDLGGFIPFERKVEINLDAQGSFINVFFHELNHFLQLKEQLLTGSNPEESLRIVAFNYTVSSINSVKEEFSTQEEANIFFQEMYEDIYKTFKTKYYDILYSKKYPRNTNPKDYFFKMGDEYNKGSSTYVSPKSNLQAYKDNFLEIQSRERGELGERIYRSEILKSSELEIISDLLEMFVDRSYEKGAVLDLIIEELEAHQNECYSPQDFCSYFIQRYLSSQSALIKPEYRNLF